MVSAVANSDVELHFVMAGADRDPEFGPAVVGRKISGIFPGAGAALDEYLAGVRSRVEMLAAVSGGRVHYGAGGKEANYIYSTLHRRLGVGAYRFILPLTADEQSPRIDIRAVREELRVTPLNAAHAAR